MFTEYLQDGVDQETNKRAFGPHRDRLAWKLSELTSQARGRIVEKAVVRELERRGFTGVEHISGRHPFDIATDQAKVESSLRCSVESNFLFQRVEPTLLTCLYWLLFILIGSRLKQCHEEAWTTLTMVKPCLYH